MEKRMADILEKLSVGFFLATFLYAAWMDHEYLYPLGTLTASLIAFILCMILTIQNNTIQEKMRAQ